MIVGIIKYHEFHQQVRIFDDSWKYMSYDLTVVTTWILPGNHGRVGLSIKKDPTELDLFDWLKTIYNWGSEWQAVKLDYKSQKLYKSRK